MRIEICIAKEKITKMPTGAVDALKEELTRRISSYDDVEVIVKATSNDGLSVTRTADKDSAKTFVQETLKIPGSLLTSGLFTNEHYRKPPLPTTARSCIQRACGFETILTAILTHQPGAHPEKVSLLHSEDSKS